MRKHILFLAGIFICNIASAQKNIINSDFNNYCGITTGACPTWPEGSDCLTGWKKSHGTPTWSSPSYVYMFGIDNAGEGIFQDHVFIPGMTYLVQLGIKSFDAVNNGKIMVYAAKGLTEAPYNSCGDVVPYADKVLIGEYSQVVNSGGGTTANISSSFTAPSGYDQIWIYPVNNDDQNGQTNLMLDYVNVCSLGNITYGDNAITAGFMSKESINIGSSFNNSSAVTTSDAANNTSMYASLIDVQPNVLISESSSNFFELIATPPCYLPLHTDPEVTANNTNIASLITNANQANEKRSSPLEQVSEIQPVYYTLYPNPTSGTFSIQLPDIASGSYTVLSVDGRTITKASFSNSPKFDVSLPSETAAGIYTVIVKTDKNFWIQKLTVK